MHVTAMLAEKILIIAHIWIFVTMLARMVMILLKQIIFSEVVEITYFGLINSNSSNTL